MANTLSLTVDSISADRTTGVLLDGTTYSSPARNTLSVYVGAYKMNQDSSINSTITVASDTDDPETAAEWTFSIPADGWFRFPMIAVPDFNAASTYAIYDAVQSAGVVYRSLQNNNTEDNLSDTDWWEVITTPYELALNDGEVDDSLNCDKLIYDVILYPNSQYEFANEISEVSEECCSVDCSLENLFRYVRLAAILDGMKVRSDRSEMSQGERLARRMEAIIESE